MTLLEDLTAHKGGLVRLKGGLYWYGGRGWDGVHDRICLLMDARDADTAVAATRGVLAAPAALRRAPVACLLIDGRPHWVWIAPADVELL
jgi:hypothetical protein